MKDIQVIGIMSPEYTLLVTVTVILAAFQNQSGRSGQYYHLMPRDLKKSCAVSYPNLAAIINSAIAC